MVINYKVNDISACLLTELDRLKLDETNCVDWGGGLIVMLLRIIEAT